jgi:hypothetical protein
VTARKLFIRAPLFDPSGGMVLERLLEIDLWWDDNQDRILDAFDITFDHFKTVKPRRKLSFRGGTKGKEGIIVLYPSDIRASVAKGLTIRLELMAILSRLPPSDRRHSYFVQIDGSGAIDYGGIELVLEKLINDSDHPEVVLGKRPNDSLDWFMGHPERKAIELFEKSLIEERFRHTVDEEFGGSLSDAQAGCWGLRLDTLRKLSLTAGGYELELDVITSALELLEHGLLGKKKVAFTRDLSYGPRIGGGGGGGSQTFQLNRAITIDKLPFFLHKLGYDKVELGGVLDKLDTSTLPHEYVIAVREWINQ